MSELKTKLLISIFLFIPALVHGFVLLPTYAFYFMAGGCFLVASVGLDLTKGRA